MVLAGLRWLKTDEQSTKGDNSGLVRPTRSLRGDDSEYTVPSFDLGSNGAQAKVEKDGYGYDITRAPARWALYTSAI